jgi:Na+/phosphate symporter
MIGWIILLGSLALILGSLFMLRDTSNTMRLSGEKLKKVLKRKAEQEALDKQDKQDD